MDTKSKILEQVVQKANPILEELLKQRYTGPLRIFVNFYRGGCTEIKIKTDNNYRYSMKEEVLKNEISDGGNMEL